LYHHSWLISCANIVRDYDFAKKVADENKQTITKDSQAYTTKNLVTFKEGLENV
jgi:hypothetical protein